MSEIRYKTVIRTRDGKLVSSGFPLLQIAYIPNKWVRAPIGGLLVWSESFKPKPTFYHDVELWEAEVRDRMELPSYRLTTVIYGELRDCIERYVQDLWEGKDIDPDFRKTWPEGTEAWREVKLLRLI